MGKYYKALRFATLFFAIGLVLFVSHAQAAVTVYGAPTNAVWSAGNTITVSIPNGGATVSSPTLVVVFGYDRGGTPGFTTPSGFTQMTAAAIDATDQGQIFYKSYLAGSTLPASLLMPLNDTGASYAGLIAMDYQGYNASSSPIDTFTSLTSTTAGNTMAGAAVTTGNAGELTVWAYGIGGDIGTNAISTTQGTTEAEVTRAQAAANFYMNVTSNTIVGAGTFGANTLSFGNLSSLKSAITFAIIAGQAGTGGTGGSDSTPPTISITTPPGGTTVSGTTTVTASASDNISVTRVEFYLDNTLQATDTTSPYNWSWNTTAVSNGSHVIIAKAYDAAGNIGTSASVTVTVSNTTGGTGGGNTGTTSAVWSLQSTSNGWQWVSPSGNIVPKYLGVSGVALSLSGGLNVSCPNCLSSKYGGSTATWASTQTNRLKSWGFNTAGEYSYEYASNYSANSLPIEASDQLSGWSRRGLSGAAFYVKNVYQDTGVGMMCYQQGTWYPGSQDDVYDSTFSQAINGLLSSSYTELSSDLIGEYMLYIPEEADDLFGMDSVTTHGDMGYEILAQIPMFATDNNGHTYTDHELYAKQAMRDYLANEYGCSGSANPSAGNYCGATAAASSLAALNSAWGTSYTTWNTTDSGGLAGITSGSYKTATWSAKTASKGFLDENGSNILSTSAASNCDLLATSNYTKVPQIQTDIDNFVGAFAATYGQTLKSALNATYPTRPPVFMPLYEGPSNVYTAMAPYFDGFWVSIAGQPFSEIQRIIAAAGGKPIIIADYDVANADSAESSRSCTNDNNNCFTTQAARGAGMVSGWEQALGQKNANGKYAVVGFEHWGLYDSTTEVSNFGLVSADHDNVYDGSANTANGEAANYGDAITPIRNFLTGVTTWTDSNGTMRTGVADPGGYGGGTPPPDTTAPTVPSGLAAGTVTTSTAALSWSASTDNVGVTGYNIYRNGSLTGTTAGTSFTNTGLTQATTYNYTVAAYDAAGNISAQSAAVQVATKSSSDSTPPSIPGSLTLGTVTTSSISFSWSASTDNVGVAGYKIYRGGIQIGTSTSLTSFTNTGLSASTTYSYTVSAYDAAGNVSAQSSALQVTTQALPDTTPPTIAITSPANHATISGSITLTATASDNLGVTSVQFTVDGTNYKSADTISPYQTTLDTTALANGTHTIGAKAFDAAGNQGNATALSVTVANTVVVNPTSTPDTTPPSVPQGVTIVGISENQIGLAWSQSTDNVGVTGYNVFRNGTEIGTTPLPSYTDQNLTPGTTYRYTVSAYDAAGNVSAQSIALQATTPTPVVVIPPTGGGTGSGSTGSGSGSSGGGGGGGGGGGSGPLTYPSAPTPPGSGSSSPSSLEALLQTLLAELQSLIAQLNGQLVGTFTRNLTIGSTGQDVQNLQIFLNDNGYPVSSAGSGSPGNESTYFGSKTSEALAKWQSANGIPATGYLGTATREKMEGEW